MENVQRLNRLDGANSVAAGSSNRCDTTPFLQGTTVIGEVNCTGFTGTVLIQTSEDGSSWTTAATITGASATDRTEKVDVALAQYVRGNVTAVTAGSVDVNLLA